MYKFLHNVNKSSLKHHLSDLLVCCVASLILATLVYECIGLNKIQAALNHSPMVDLSMITSELNISKHLEKSNSMSRRLLISIGLSIIVLVTIFSFSLAHNFIIKKGSEQRKKVANKYQDYLSHIISESNNNFQNYKSGSRSEKVSLTKDDIYNVNNRAVLLSELKGMHSLIAGNDKTRLSDIYFSLGFVEELSEKFKSTEWTLRAEAITETLQFKVQQYYNLVNKLVNDHNLTVSQNALVASVSINKEPLAAFRKINRKLSQWDQHCIIDELKKLPRHKLPRFDKIVLDNTINQEFINELQQYFHNSENTQPKLYVA